MAEHAFPLSKLEQLPLNFRAEAIEAAIEPFKIAKGNADPRWHALIEPFRDVNANGLRRLYVVSRNYFRSSIEEFRDFGMTPLWATDDFPQEAFFGSVVVLSEKRSG